MDYIDEFEDAIDAELMGVEAKVLGMIAETVGKVSEGLPAREALARVSGDVKKAGEIMSKAARDIEKTSAAVEAAMVEENDEWSAPYYEAAGTVATGASSAIVRDAAEDAVSMMRDALKTSVVGFTDASGKNFKPLAEAYRAVITDVSAKMAQGEATGEKAVREAVRRLSSGGLRVAYESGRTMELHSAVRMAVGDTFRRAMNDSRAKMGDEFGADGVEISAHGLCATDHLPYQGKQYAKKAFEKIQDGLERPIGEGYNCRHIVFPIVVGVSEPAYTAKELDEISRLSTDAVTYTVGGQEKQSTRYEFSQYQRSLERGIRKARMGAYIAEKSGVGEAEANRRVRELLRGYRTVSNQAGIDTMQERTKLYIPR